MSQAEYTMHVYVIEDKGAFKIDNIIVNKKKDDKGTELAGKVDNIGDNADTNTFRFVNTYVQEAGTGIKPTEPGNDYTKYGSLNVSKTVVNALTKAAQSFTFTANFTFPTGTDATTLKGVKANGTDITNQLNSGYTFKLENGGNMKFTGLPVGTTIAVTETATPKYEGSAAVIINGEKGETFTADGYNKDLSVSGKKLGQNRNEVDVTNTYDNVPTTGIIMNTLPYVLMVSLCGVALVAFVASKRRKVHK